MADAPKKVKPIVEVRKGELVVLCPCHKEVIASSKPMDISKDGELIIAPGKGATKWCKENDGAPFEWPEVAAKVFWPAE